MSGIQTKIDRIIPGGRLMAVSGPPGQLHYVVEKDGAQHTITDVDLENLEDDRREHVVLVAISVNDSTFKDGQKAVIEALQPLLEKNGGPLVSWWIAEDERYDGSDNDSAVFVPVGTQQVCSDMVAAFRAAR